MEVRPRICKVQILGRLLSVLSCSSTLLFLKSVEGCSSVNGKRGHDFQSIGVALLTSQPQGTRVECQVLIRMFCYPKLIRL